MRVTWRPLARLRRDQARYRWYALGVTTFDRTGSYRIAWLVVAVAVLVGLVSALCLREDRHPSIIACAGRRESNRPSPPSPFEAEGRGEGEGEGL